MGNPLLACHSLCRVFPVRGGQIAVLNGVNLSVEAGEVVVVRGRSGAGKSTLLWLLSGLDRPTTGEVLLKGRSLADTPDRELLQIRRNTMSVIFQDFNLVASWTALENVEAALRHSGMPRQSRQEKAEELLNGLGLGNRLGSLPSDLSLGEQQRTAIARALVVGPELVLADEPTGAVDPETARDITDALIGPVRETGATILVVTHGSFPLGDADRVLLLRDGVLSVDDSQR